MALYVTTSSSATGNLGFTGIVFSLNTQDNGALIRITVYLYIFYFHLVKKIFLPGFKLTWHSPLFKEWQEIALPRGCLVAVLSQAKLGQCYFVLR